MPLSCFSRIPDNICMKNKTYTIILGVVTSLVLNSCSGNGGLEAQTADLLPVIQPEEPIQPEAPVQPEPEQPVNNAPPSAQPYAHYANLDLAAVEFHNSAGSWGPQKTVEAPEAPVTNRDVTVTNQTDLTTNARIPGSRITIGADINPNGMIVISGNIVDVDIIIPQGRILGHLVVGGYNSADSINRFRIRGSTIGQYSGGLLSGVTYFGDPGDLILDGIGIRDLIEAGGTQLAIHFGFSPSGHTADRVAVVNCVIRTSAAAVLGHVKQIVFAGNSIVSGDRTRAVNGSLEGWGIRLEPDVAIFYGNRIEGTRYHRIRLHPRIENTSRYGWISNNVFVDPNEARIIWAADLGPVNGRPASNMNAMIIKNNIIHAHSTCMPPSFEPIASNYVQTSSNTFMGGFTSNSLTTLGQNFGMNLIGEATTFASWQLPPAWSAPGDPRVLIPLMPVIPARFNASYDNGTGCPGPQ